MSGPGSDAAPRFSRGWSAVLKRTCDQVTVVGHGLLVYGAARLFGEKTTDAPSGALILALVLGIVCQIAVNHVTYVMEMRREH
jgi:hypothetical protein